MTEGNVLYYGDNLDVLRRHVADESVDLVYLDPPFNSNATYNVLFSEHGEKSAAQVRAFEDTWVWDTNARLAYEETVEMGGRVADALRAFRTMLGASDMLAYLSMMAPRLIELRRVLKPSGSLYLHCDPTASHYLKVLLDSIFLPTNFRGEVHWKRTSSHNDSRRWPQIHDTLLFYAGPGFTWNPIFLEHDPDYLTKFYRHHDARGRYRLHEIIRTGSMGPRPNLAYEYKGYTPQWGWRTVREKLEALDAEDRIEWGTSGRPYLKRYLDEQEGTMASSLWTDIPPLSFAAAEKLGFPTQKPLALLERIVKASSNPGDLVLDPFCGCGTTIDAAQALDRRWIGIDITHLSIGLIKHRLTRYGPKIAPTYRVVGEPTAVEDAAELARQDPFQFQAWALGLVGARIAGSDKKGGDKGIDGRLYFHEGTNSPTRQIILSVKAGNIVPTYVDALWGVVEREKAEIGVLLSFQEPSPGMRARAAEAGFYESPWGKHPRLQLRTIRELLAGKGIDYPHVTGANVTLRRAQKARPAEAEAMEMFGRAAEEPAEYD